MSGTGAAAAVAFVCAMPMELDPLLTLVPGLGPAEPPDGIYRGVLAGRPVVAIVTGMGTDLATEGITALLDAATVGHVVVVGITGALEAETPLGTLVWPAVVVDGTTGAEFRPAPRPGAAASVPAGVMWTADRLIEDPAEVAALRDRGVVALDMETAAVAAVCEARGVPWSVVRAISDRAGDGSVDAEVFALSKPDGTPDDEAVVRYFAEHPERAEALAALAEGALAGAQAAAEAAVDAARAVAATLPPEHFAT